jgi:tetratricopeptide (TPR) repeat protein
MRIFFLTLSIFCFQTICCQKTDYILPAEFVYGNAELDSFVYDNFVRPDFCLENGINFNITLRFTVDTLGMVSYVDVLSVEPVSSKWTDRFKAKIDSLKPKIKEEAIRTFEFSSGFWIPRKAGGKLENEIFTYSMELRTPEFYSKADGYRQFGIDVINMPYYIPLDVPYTNAVKYYNLGVKKISQKKYYIAIKYLKHSISLGNRTKDVFYNLGVALLFNDEKESACKSWSKALELGDTEAQGLIDKYCNP